MLKEFKEFIVKGNAVDLAIGVIIGAAFGAVVTSLVNDILMPVIGAITGGLDFSNYFIGLSSDVTAASLEEAKKQGAVFAWGSLLTKVVNLLLVGWILFIVVKAINRLKREEEAAPPAPPAPSPTETLLSEIRDLLAKKK